MADIQSGKKKVYLSCNPTSKVYTKAMREVNMGVPHTE